MLKKIKGNAIFVSLTLMIIVSILTYLLFSITDIGLSRHNQSLNAYRENVTFQSVSDLLCELSLSQLDDFNVKAINGYSISKRVVNYGFFTLINITLTKDEDKKNRVFLGGEELGSSFSIINLSNTDILKVSGNSVLEGSYLGNAYGLDVTNVYKSDSIKLEKSELTVLQRYSILQRLETNFLAVFEKRTSEVFQPFIKEEKTNSFQNAPQRVDLSETDSVFNLELSGNYYIDAGESLYIDSSCHLNYTIIYGERIIVGQGFQGRVQLLSTRSLEVQSNCDLLYPSILSLYTSSGSAELNEISIGNNCSISGGVYAYSDVGNKCKVFSEGYVDIVGSVVSNSYLDLSGFSLKGLACGQFVRVTKAGQVEDNILFDAKLKSSGVKAKLVGMSLLQNDARLFKIHWLE